jgi:hypothetical protein
MLDAGAMEPLLQRSLRHDLQDAPMDDLRIARVRYDPGERIIAHYRMSVGGRDLNAVATTIARQDLGTKVHNPRFRAMASDVNGRSPGERPVIYDEDVNAIIAWLPFDVKLPGLAVPPSVLAQRLRLAGVHLEEEEGHEPLLIGYKPASRAVLRLGDQVLKAYGKARQFDAARIGLIASGRAPLLCAPKLRANFGDLRLTAQSLVEGTTPADAGDAADEAGSFLRLLQHHEFDELEPSPPEHQLSEAGRHARVAGAIVPEEGPRLEKLMDRLRQSMPRDGRFVSAHGDFHVDQLIVTKDWLTVIDFDGMCTAPAALDVATFAADVVRGRKEDLERVHSVLESLCEGFCGTPDHIDWYLSTAILCRATHPFRAQAPDWPKRVAATIQAADEVLP